MTKRVDQRLGILGPDPSLLGAPTPIALDLTKLPELHLASQRVAHEVALRLALGECEPLRLVHQVLRDSPTAMLRMSRSKICVDFSKRSTSN